MVNYLVTILKRFQEISLSCIHLLNWLNFCIHWSFRSIGSVLAVSVTSVARVRFSIFLYMHKVNELNKLKERLDDVVIKFYFCCHDSQCWNCSFTACLCMSWVAYYKISQSDHLNKRKKTESRNRMLPTINIQLEKKIAFSSLRADKKKFIIIFGPSVGLMVPLAQNYFFPSLKINFSVSILVLLKWSTYTFRKSYTNMPV